MNETNDWFYTRDGEQVGPVSFAALQEKATDHSLDPRQDVVWRRGMDTWVPAGEIEGLFEKRTPEAEKTPAPLEAPSQTLPPPSVATRENSREEVTAEPQQNWPGAKRSLYITLTFVLLILLFRIISPLMIQQMGMQTALPIIFGMEVFWFVTAVWVAISRLGNLGMSRLWIFGGIVPILNLWLGFRCFACPSGYAVHKKMDTIGIALAFFYWLLVCLIIWMIYRTVTDPELQKEFHRQLDEAMKAMQEAQKAAPKP